MGGGSSDVIQVGFALIVGLWVWGWFHSRQAGHSRELEALAWPRRLYLIGMGAVLGITAAVGLIFTLVVIVQRIVGSDDNSSLLLPASIFVITAAVAWYLIVLYQRDQEFSESGVSAGPFKVTIVTSHPGPISTLFPDNARLEVIYRADDSGAISDEMAESIVEEVGDEASVVWVDDDGYRITRTRID